MAATRKPRVHLDTSCFGRLADSRGEALDAAKALIAEINYRQLVYISSAWVVRELEQVEPKSLRSRFLANVPKGDWIQWDAALGRDARRWALALGLDDDESGEADCRHLACALRGDARFLVTHDSRFFEAMRQSAKILTPLRPVKLVGWQEVIFEH